jgi:hypothetical protein
MDVCPVCGETDMRPFGWRQCPACTHPYPPEEAASDGAEIPDEDRDEDDLDEEDLDEDEFGIEEDSAFFDDVGW